MFEALNNILQIGGIGCIIFSILIVIVGYTGMAAETRDEEGHFKKKLTWKSLLGFTLFIAFFIGLLYGGNINLIHKLGNTPEFWLLCLNAFGIFLVVDLYDLIVLDYLIIVKWHPKFLKLPDTDYYNIMKPHLIGFIRGLPLGIIVSLMTSLAAYFLN